MRQNSTALLKILNNQKIIPVLIIKELEHAVPLARALVKGGLTSLEITLRSSIALEAIECIKKEVEGVKLGAGTILNVKDFEKAHAAGAEFIVSPGFRPALAHIAEQTGVPLLPGAITPSEILAALEEGYNYLKFFPAEQAGGQTYMKALASPFNGVKFCPTGGINAQSASDWLSLENVFCIGGSWIAPQNLIEEGAFDKISQLAQKACQLNCP